MRTALTIRTRSAYNPPEETERRELGNTVPGGEARVSNRKSTAQSSQHSIRSIRLRRQVNKPTMYTERTRFEELSIVETVESCIVEYCEPTRR